MAANRNAAAKQKLHRIAVLKLKDVSSVARAFAAVAALRSLAQGSSHGNVACSIHIDIAGREFVDCSPLGVF
jgi:hypothetical protein